MWERAREVVSSRRSEDGDVRIDDDVIVESGFTNWNLEFHARRGGRDTGPCLRVSARGDAGN